MTGLQDSGPPSWLQPPDEQEGLRRYLEVLRERRWTIVSALVLTVLAAIGYLATASKVYEAEANILVTPASSDDPTLASLPLIRESSDPTRDVETASLLITTIDVAERARRELGLETEASHLLDAVIAEPVAQSNIVAITAEADSAAEAQDLANAFADAAVKERTTQLRDAIDLILPSLLTRQEAATTPSAELAAQIIRLETLENASDPTLRVETQATLPTSPASPRPMLTLAAAILAGLVLGVGAAFTAQTLDPLLRREAQLRSRYRLPILGRIPREAGRAKDKPLGPQNLSMPTLEAYRTLRASINAAHRRRKDTSEAMLITGSSPSEGKTTTAVNLACSFALSGNRVILIEADLRRPAIGKTLGISPEHGVVSVLLENASLEEALVTAPSFGLLQVLLADYEGSWIAELFSLPAAERLIEDARELADYVIIDSPPLTSVIDSLPLASKVDDVLIVTRLGVSRLARLHELAELLAANDIRPVGLAVVGVSPPHEGAYYYRSGAERGLTHREEVSDLAHGELSRGKVRVDGEPHQV